MVDLIAPDRFGTLRLDDLVPANWPREPRVDWEYEEDLWVGEGTGFTEVLALAEAPADTRAVALDLVELPAAIASAALRRLALPVAPGANAAAVRAALGEPARTST